jgi:hypothetical protein
MLVVLKTSNSLQQGWEVMVDLRWLKLFEVAKAYEELTFVTICLDLNQDWY